METRIPKDTPLRTCRASLGNLAGAFAGLLFVHLTDLTQKKTVFSLYEICLCLHMEAERERETEQRDANILSPSLDVAAL